MIVKLQSTDPERFVKEVCYREKGISQGRGKSRFCSGLEARGKATGGIRWPVWEEECRKSHMELGAWGRGVEIKSSGDS